MNEYTYMFIIKIDGGAAFQEKRTITERGRGYEYAEDKVMRRLRDEFADKVAFFDVVTWKRLG